MTHSAEQLHLLHRLAHREWNTAARRLGLSFNEFEYLSAVYEEERLQRYEDKHGQHLQEARLSDGLLPATTVATTFVAMENTRSLGWKGAKWTQERSISC